MKLGRKVALNAVALSGARIANALLGVVAVGITTRYLGVDGYGALVVALAFVAVIGTLNDIGVGTVVAREIAKRPDEERRLVNAGFSVVLVLSAAGAVVGLLAMFLVYPGAGRELEREGIAVLLLAPLPFAAAGAAAGAYFVSQQRAYMGGLASLGGGVLNLVLLGLAVVLDWGFAGVAVAYAGQAIGFGGLMAYASRRLHMRPGLDLALCWQLLRWALPLGGALIIGALYYRIDVVLLSFLGTERDVGLYGLAYRFVDTLLVIPAYVTITLLPEFARLQEQRTRLAELMQKAFDVMVVGLVPVLIGFIAFAAEIAEILGGPSFVAAGTVLRILIVAVGAAFLSAIFVEPIVALGHQAWMLQQSLVLLVVNVVANVLLISPYGATGAAVAFLITEALALVVTAALYGRLARLPRPKRAPRVLAAGAGMVAVTLLKTTPLDEALGNVGTLLVLGPLGLVVYVAGLYLFRGMPPELHDTVGRPLLGRIRSTMPLRGHS